MHIFTTLLCLHGAISLVLAWPSKEELHKSNQLCAYGNLNVWQIREDDPDAVIHHQWPEKSFFHVKQVVTDKDRYERGSSVDSYQYQYIYNSDESKILYSNPKPVSRVFTIGLVTSIGLGAYGCELRFALAPNVTDLVVLGKPAISARVFNWSNGWDFKPTWRNVMSSEASRVRYLGPTIGKVRDVRLGQDDIINATACPAGMADGKPSFVAFMFEIDESVKESAEVEFSMWADHSMYNRTMAGVWLRFPSPICDSQVK